MPKRNIVCLSTVSIAIVLFAALFLLSSCAQKYEVPDVLGMKAEEAEEALSDAGFTKFNYIENGVDSEYLKSDRKKYIVTKLSPSAGSHITKDTTIKIYIAKDEANEAAIGETFSLLDGSTYSEVAAKAKELDYDIFFYGKATGNNLTNNEMMLAASKGALDNLTVSIKSVDYYNEQLAIYIDETDAETAVISSGAAAEIAASIDATKQYYVGQKISVTGKVTSKSRDSFTIVGSDGIEYKCKPSSTGVMEYITVGNTMNVDGKVLSTSRMSVNLENVIFTSYGS